MQFDDLVDARKISACKLILNVCEQLDSPRGLFWREKGILARIITHYRHKVKKTPHPILCPDCKQYVTEVEEETGVCVNCFDSFGMDREEGY